MPTLVTLTATTGTLPLNLWICDSTGATATCIYYDTVTSLPYPFVLPTVYETYPSYALKIIDANLCIYYELSP
jgi:hypothetical protein